MAATSEAPAPKRAVRLLLWFGIYLAGPLPLVLHGACGGLPLLFFFSMLLPLAMLPASFGETPA
jgi:hypothetical protein